MELNHTQELQHQLKLTQEMRTSLQLLAFSGTELLDYIMAEAENNPVVDPDQVIRDVSCQSEELSSYSRRCLPDADELQKGKDYEMQSLTSQGSLYDFLEEQLDQLKMPEPVENTALWIVNSLNQDGFFLDEAFLPEPFHQSYEEALSAVQSLSPAGIGARSLSESLLIQARRKGLKDPILLQMIREDLVLLGERSFLTLNVKYGIQNASDYLTMIRSFHPRPASGIPNYEPPQHITVDVFFEKDDEGFISPRLNDRYTPTLTIPPVYSSLIADLAEETKGIYLNYLNRVSYLNQSILKRNETLLRVAQAIIRKQRGFFTGESQFLGPLTLREIAEDIGNHVSTVSRAVRDKYVGYDGRVIPLKSFFSTALPTGSDAGGVRKDRVMDVIIEILKKENKAKPLSDEKIVQELIMHDIAISRRTVAKYRDELNIPSMSRRKQPL